eukprot:227209-Chlamydomonas_euryale.AAC.1
MKGQRAGCARPKAMRGMDLGEEKVKGKGKTAIAARSARPFWTCTLDVTLDASSVGPRRLSFPSARPAKTPITPQR